MPTSNQLLTVIVPDEIKDDLIDQLMSLNCISGFNLDQMKGYSQAHSHFDISEQVEGFRKLNRFEILHSNSDEESILSSLKDVCNTAKARYWISPVLSSGHF